MNRDSWIAKAIFFPLLVGGLFSVGAMIPTFYEWSGANQNRPSPYLSQAFNAVVGFMIVAWIALPWIPWGKKASLDELNQAENLPEGLVGDRKHFQFNLRSLIVVTTSFSIAIAGLTSFRLVTIVWVIALNLFISAWFVMHCLSVRWRISAVLACMYFPYAWVLFSDDFKDVNSEHLLAAVGLPMFIPSIFIGHFIGIRAEEHAWLPILVTCVELAIGIWLARLGPRKTIAWIIAVVFVSLLGSCVLDAGMRI